MTVPHLAMAGLAEAAFFYQLLICWAALALIAILLVLAFVFRSRTTFVFPVVLMAVYIWVFFPWRPLLVSPSNADDPDYRYWILRFQTLSYAWIVLSSAIVVASPFPLVRWPHGPELRQRLRGLSQRFRRAPVTWGFCALSFAVMIGVWFSDSIWRFLALESFYMLNPSVGVGEPAGWPSAVITHAFVHARLAHWLCQALLIMAAGLILEPRLGSLRTAGFMAIGIALPGLVWYLLPGVSGLNGAGGVSMTLTGGLVALWQQRGWALTKDEKVVAALLFVVAALVGLLSLVALVVLRTKLLIWPLPLGTLVAYLLVFMALEQPGGGHAVD